MVTSNRSFTVKPHRLNHRRIPPKDASLIKPKRLNRCTGSANSNRYIHTDPSHTTVPYPNHNQIQKELWHQEYKKLYSVQGNGQLETRKVKAIMLILYSSPFRVCRILQRGLHNRVQGTSKQNKTKRKETKKRNKFHKNPKKQIRNNQFCLSYCYSEEQ